MANDLTDIVTKAEVAVALDYYKRDLIHTEIGEAIHNLKYKRQRDQSQINEDYKTVVAHFISYIAKNFDITFDFIIPVPSYNPKTPLNQAGEVKVMYEVATVISALISIPLDYSSVTKLVDKQAKNGFLKPDDFYATKIADDYQELNILLIDDLFGEGNSVNFTIEAIKAANPTAKVYFISATNNKYGGLGKEVPVSIDFTRHIQTSKAGNEYITVIFMYNGNEEHGYVYDTHESYPTIRGMLHNLDCNNINLKVKKNSKGYWTAL